MKYVAKPIEVDAEQLSEDLWVVNRDGFSIYLDNNNFHALYATVPDFSWREDCYAAFINLDHRADRRERMEAELDKAGISADRVRGMYVSEYNGDPNKVKKMLTRSNGAVGCTFSQIAIMQSALRLGQSAFVLEDDVVFSSDWQKRMDYVQNFLNKNEWDIFWLGGTYHIEPTWHPDGHANPDMRECTCNKGKDVERTDDPRIVRTYGCWSTYAYIVNYNSLPKILKLIDDNVQNSYVIDHLFIMLQPLLKTFAFIPGMVKQIDNVSDIQGGDLVFSEFAKLGSHWYADRMEDVDPNSINI